MSAICLLTQSCKNYISTRKEKKKTEIISNLDNQSEKKESTNISGFEICRAILTWYPTVT